MMPALMESSLFNRSLAVVFSIVALVTACGEGVQPEQRELVYFTAIETELPEPQAIPDPGPQLQGAQSSTYEPIVNGFVENHERLLQREDIKGQIERIENIFIALGRYHEIAAMFRDEWERAGTDSYVADRWAWALIRLGQRQQAREVLDKLLADRPDDPKVHFLDGAYWVQEQPRETEDLRKVVRAWKRVVELDPDYRGFENMNADVLRQQVAAFEADLGPVEPGADAAAVVAAATDRVQRSATLALSVAEPVLEELIPTEPDEEQDQAGAEEPPADQPTTPQPGEMSIEDQYKLAVARGQIELAQGNYNEAENAFLMAKSVDPDGFEANFGQLQAGWGNPSARNQVAAAVRELAKREDLEPSQQVDIGVFLWTKMARKDLARDLLESAKAKDPTLAGRVDRLLKQM